MKEPNFFIKDDSDFPAKKWFVLNGDWHEEYKNIILANEIKSFRIANPMWYKNPTRDISFLSELLFLKDIQICCDQKVDLTVLYNLPKIKSLSLVDCDFDGPFDLNHFELTELSISCSENLIGLSGQSKLEKLFIEYATDESFGEINFFKLNNLKLYNSPKLADISSLGVADNLESLELYNCSNIESIEAVGSCGRLRVLAIDKCKGVNDISALVGHSSLEFFRIENCGNVKTLSPLLSCDNLKKIAFLGKGILIEDGDFNDFMTMESLLDFRFQNRRSYKPKFQEFKEWSWGKAKSYLASKDILEWKVININEDDITLYIPQIPFFGTITGVDYKLNSQIECRVLSFNENKTVSLKPV